MEKTGESYTAARATLLAATEPEGWLATSDETIRERTGRGWEEWFDALDAWGAQERTHREIARWLAGQQGGIDPLAWNAQAIAMSYERTRGMRVAGQRVDGFAATVTRTVGVPVERLYEAFMAAAPAELRERTATAPKRARFDWGDGRVAVTFDPKDDRATVSLEHSRLADAGEAERMKAFWREHLTALKERLDA
jgi:uncharacterized protein YndB with AHSA1/START domain